jgi:hypothetical protein
VNDIPLVHGFALIDLVNIIGNQAIYINRLQISLEETRRSCAEYVGENERLRRRLEEIDGRLEQSKPN